MRRPSKWIAAGLLAVLMAGLVGGSTPIEHAAQPEADHAAPYIPPTFFLALDDALAQGEDYIEMELTVPSQVDLQLVRDKVNELGGEVLREEQAYAQIKVPLGVASTIPTSIPATSLGVNQSVKADRAALILTNSPLERSAAAQSVKLNFDASGIIQFRERYGVVGAGVKVAVIDSGIDPGHPDLRQTPDGQPKLIDWKDFTTEGRVQTPFLVEWGPTYTVSGRTYRLPLRPAASQTARFGFWEENKVQGMINRDLDRNGLTIDRFGVLLVDSRVTGVYDLIYVDTNNDDNFTDEQPLRLFRESQTTGRLGRFRTGDAAEQQLNFVVADVDRAGGWVHLGFDGHGHGTQVAGVLAAYNPSGYTGVAPGAQLMALKVINAKDEGHWFQIRDAIIYAADQGASIINVSIGGLPIASAYDTAASEMLNRIAREYGVLIVLASDNTGPGLSSGATIGNPNEMLAVGAYYSPAMWKRDYGYIVPSEGIWWQSGMGPRSDGSSLPNLVAPGGSPTTSPHWAHKSGYVTAAGTSIAAPHVSGSAALLIEAGRRNGLLYDRESIKRALEFGAQSQQLSNVPAFEQGHGLLGLEASFQQLRLVNTVPSISGQTLEGKGGLLARSYRPGSTAFVITNPSDTLTRLTVFSSEEWVRPQLQSLTMPPGASRQLPLDFDPPTFPGVHTAFLRLSQQDRYGPSLTIPITYVNPVRLTGKEPAYSTMVYVEVARYSRHFVEVRPGSNRLQVSTRVQTGQQGVAQGSVQVQVFRPDGVLAFRSNEFGAKGNGLSSLFAAEQPVDGVWEVVVTALPDTEGLTSHAAYKLDIEVAPNLLDVPIRLAVQAGSTTTHDIRVANPHSALVGQVEAYGLVRQEQSTPWRVVRELHAIDTFTLDTTAALVRLEIDNALPAGTDLSLHLFRRGDPNPVWESVTPGTSKEKIELWDRDLPAGQYQVFVNASSRSGLQYQYRRMVANQAYHLSVKDEPRRRERGQIWTVPLTVYAPTVPGRYKGQVILVDTEKGETVAWYPIEVSVSQPTLTVEPMVSQLKQDEAGSVVLEVRETKSRALVNGTITVNGQRYVTRNGRVTVFVRPKESAQSLQVEVDLPSHQFYRQEIRVPVRNTWGAHPTGVDTNPESSLWRRKIESLLP